MSLPGYFGSQASSAKVVWDLSSAIPELGFEYISDTAKHTGPYHRLMCLADGTIDLSDSNITGNTHNAVAMKQGQTIVAWFASLTAASGAFAAYKPKS